MAQTLMLQRNQMKLQQFISHSALFLACKSSKSIHLVSYLISKGIDMNTPDYFYHDTALHNACSNGNKTIVKLLLSKGSDVNAFNDIHYYIYKCIIIL